MTLFRERPHWQVLLFYYGFGIAVVLQLTEDLWVGQSKVHSGEFFPWRQKLDFSPMLGQDHYWWFVAAEVVLLVLYFLRINVRWTAALLAIVLFADNLGSFLNHRLLMSIEMLMVSFVPVPRNARESSYRGTHWYWNIDVICFQVSVVYVTTAIHKLNGQFLSGQALQNLFWMVQEHGMKTYPDWLVPFLQDTRLCLAMAWSTVILEFVLAIGLHSRRLAPWLLPLAVIMHVSFALLMPHVGIFTIQMLFTLMLFLPTVGYQREAASRMHSVKTQPAGLAGSVPA